MRQIAAFLVCLCALPAGAALFLTLALPLTASAALRYWDNDGIAAGNDAATGAGLGGTGTWDTATAKWWDGTSTDVVWNNANNDDAIFSLQKTTTGNDSVTVTIATGETMTVNSITFNQKTTTTGVTTYIITGGTGINLTSGMITAPTGNNGNGNINTPITTAGNLILVSNNTTANNNNIQLSAANTIGGDVYLTGGGVPTSSGWSLKLNLNAVNAIPSTADFFYDRNQSQVNYNAALAFGTVPNNFFLNNLNQAGTFEGSIGALAGATVTLSGVVSGTSDLRFGLGLSGGAGIITLTNNSTYTGNTRFLHAPSGVVKLGVNDALPTTTGLSFGTGATNSGSLDLAGFNQTVASLASPVTTGTVNGITNTQGGTTSTLTINGSATTTYVGNIGVATNITNLAGSSDNIALVLHADNTGVQTLSRPGGNTYTGGTTINGGTLLVTNTSGSGTGTGAVTVNGGTLGGTGIITGAVTVNGGTLAPGTSAGTLSLGNGLVLNSASQLAYELAANNQTQGSGVNDLTVVTGNLTLAGTLSVSEISGSGTFLADAQAGDEWTLITYSGNLTDLGFALGSMPALSDGLLYEIQAAVGKVSLLVSAAAVPEAGSFAAVALVGLFSLGAVWVRKRVGRVTASV